MITLTKALPTTSLETTNIPINLRLLRIRRQPLQPILPLPPHLPRPTRINPKLRPIGPQSTIARRRAPQARFTASAVGDIALDAAGADGGGGGVGGVEVGWDGGIVGEREFGLAVRDDFGLKGGGKWSVFFLLQWVGQVEGVGW